MGKVIDALDKVVDVVDDAIDAVVDAVDDLYTKVIEPSVKFIYESTVGLASEVAYETIIKGESFSGSLANNLQEISEAMAEWYNETFDDVLGIDDTKFLGIKGGFGSWLGSGVKDIMHDHATTTVGIAAIVGMIVLTIVTMGAAAPWLAAAASWITGAVGAGVLASNIIYFALYGLFTLIASFGLSMLLSPIMDGIMQFMQVSGTNMLPGLVDKLVAAEQLKDTIRLGAFNDVASMTNFEKMAGGSLYNAVYAGGSLYEYDQNHGLDTSVGGNFTISEGNKNIGLIGMNQAGEGQWEAKFKLISIDTNTDEGGGSTNPMAAVQKQKIDMYNQVNDKYNAKVSEYNALVDKSNAVADSFNSLASHEKTQSRYDATMSEITSLQDQVSAVMDDINKLQDIMGDFFDQTIMDARKDMVEVDKL